MNNNLNEKSSGGIIIAAIISAMVVLITGLIAGLVLGIRSYGNRDNDRHNEPRISQYLLVDAADGLRRSASALRLSNSADSASETVKNALVYATRAETALECDGGTWDEGREKEAFLNDAYSLLSRPDPMHAVEKADELYRLSVMFCDSLNGGTFEYNGELSGVRDNQTQETAAEYSEEAAKLIESVLGVEPQYIGGFGERRDFSVDRDGVNGYATVTGDKITEFSFPHNGGDGDVNPETAERLALETAEKCGFGDLYVYGIERTDGGLAVKMCKACHGALCRDECAVAVVTGEKVSAFTAGKCGCDHELPDPVYSEQQAKINAPDGGEGRLVTINDGERDRICYEYRYELDDGEHFVYVCAQNGKQMGIR